MYAYDIILVSTSAPGLQEKIGILGKFCDDWCLTVNIQKTKIMVYKFCIPYLNFAEKVLNVPQISQP
jgi:sRNA-binding regulator protein Hfq